MRLLYFVFALGVLTANIYAQVESEDAEVTVGTTIVTDGDITSVPTDAASTTPSADGTTAPADSPTTGETDTPGTTQAPNTPAETTQGEQNTGTTVEVTIVTGQTAAPTDPQVTGGSTKPAAPSTVAGSTKKPTPPAATTLLPVTVSYAAFTYSCVQSAQCIYTFNAPINSQSFLATEESVIQGNKNTLSDTQTQINQYKTNVTLVFDPENNKVQALQDQLQAAQVALNALQANIAAIRANQQKANANLVVLNQYINGLQANKNTCYYQQCMKPTPPPTTTPTTTKPPTTTISPCVGYCTNATLVENRLDDKCNMQQNGPFCDCKGNLDGYQQCALSACSGFGKQALPAAGGPFWSPGYAGNPDSNTAYPVNSTCIWSFTGSYQVNGTLFSVDKLDSTSTLILNYGSGTTAITKNWRLFNAALASTTQFTITLTSGATATNENYFYWTMFQQNIKIIKIYIQAEFLSSIYTLKSAFVTVCQTAAPTDPQVTGGSTKPAAPSTVAGSTKKPTPPAATTLLPVTVSYAAFTYSCVQSAQCIYTFNAPINSQSFLATEESVIQGNKNTLSDTQTQINQYKTNVTLVFDPENNKVQALQDQLQAAQVALNALQANIAAIRANQQKANANLVVLNQYINGLQANKNTCYYQQCMKPTPPPTTTPTTTKPPTTTISPCVGYCTNATLVENRLDDKCNMQQNGPFCDCKGNLDGYQQCALSACSGFGKQALPAAGGPFWSPGYAGNPDSNTAYPVNSTCIWSFTGSYQVNGTLFSVDKLDSTSTLILNYGSGTTAITKNWRLFNAALASTTQFTITLTSGATATNENYFYWTMFQQ